MTELLFVHLNLDGVPLKTVWVTKNILEKKINSYEEMGDDPHRPTNNNPTLNREWGCYYITLRFAFCTLHYLQNTCLPIVVITGLVLIQRLLVFAGL